MLVQILQMRLHCCAYYSVTLHPRRNAQNCLWCQVLYYFAERNHTQCFYILL